MCSLKGMHTTFIVEEHAGSMHVAVIAEDPHW